MKDNLIWSLKKILAGLSPADAKTATGIALKEYEVGTTKLGAVEPLTLKAEPSQTLYSQVQAAFLLNNSSLSKWCVANKVPREKVRACLVHKVNGAKALALRNRIVLASGATKVFPLNRENLKPVISVACVNTFKKDKSQLSDDKEVRDFIATLPHMTQTKVREAIEVKFGAERTPSQSGLNRYFMKQRKRLEQNNLITLVEEM